jgi:hypothetical protein
MNTIKKAYWKRKGKLNLTSCCVSYEFRSIKVKLSRNFARLHFRSACARFCMCVAVGSPAWTLLSDVHFGPTEATVRSCEQKLPTQKRERERVSLSTHLLD